MGRRFSRPRLMLRRAIKARKLTMPVFACSPAILAIMIGPPMLSADMLPPIILATATTVSLVTVQVCSAPFIKESRGPNRSVTYSSDTTIPITGEVTVSPRRSFAVRISGVTCTAKAFPFRFRSRSRDFPPLPAMRSAISFQLDTLAPFMATTLSPGMIPALAAGLSFMTSPIFEVAEGTPIMQTVTKAIYAKIILNTGPAATMRKRCNGGFAIKDRS